MQPGSIKAGSSIRSWLPPPPTSVVRHDCSRSCQTSKSEMKSIRCTQSDIVNGLQEPFGFAMYFRQQFILDIQPALDIRQDLSVKARTGYPVKTSLASPREIAETISVIARSETIRSLCP